VSGARLVVETLPAAGLSCRIAGDEAAHARARRLAPGDEVILVDGSGQEAIGRLTAVGPQALEVLVESVRRSAEVPAPIHLIVAALRSERVSWIAEKATELGADRLTLVTSQRTQRFRASPALGPRLARVVREAAKQAERASWPAIAGPLPFADALNLESSGSRFILDPSGEPFPPVLPAGRTSLMVGPEGGWTDAELEAALAAGWVATSLAAGKLRAETAAVAALILARSALARGIAD